MPDDFRRFLSVSRMSSVLGCGRKYEIERVEKKPSRQAAWTARGIAAHEAIEEWEKSARSIDPIKYFHESAWPKALEECLKRYPKQSEWIKTPNVKSVARDLILREADGANQVLRYVERALDEADDWRVVETEFKFEIEFSEFWVIGYIDQIREWSDGELSIWDIKTGADDRESNRQLGTYKVGYQLTTGKDIRYGSYHYTKLDRASKPVDLSPYTKDYVHKEFLKLDRILEQKLFIANPSIKNCNFCPVAKHCVESMYEN